MKILVLSLLRLGDILLQAPALRALRDRYPDAQIDLLINKQCQGVRELLPYVDHFHLFERDEYQRLLTSNEAHLYTAYDKVECLIQTLNQQKYQHIYNWTHNRLSAYLMGALECADKQGLQILGEQVSVTNPWFRYLNSTQNNRDNKYHYSDLFLRSIEGELPLLPTVIAETPSGQKEAAQFERTYFRVLIQALTGDPKKNWGLANFASFVRDLSHKIPGTQFLFLCAPNEKAQLEKFLDQQGHFNNQAQLACVTLSGALSLLRSSDLLVTGDTSIKHLASYADCRVIELVLGSSQMHETGVYRAGQWMIQNQETCSPCSHFNKCHRETHACAQTISPRLVSQLAESVYSKNSPVLDTMQLNRAKIYMSRQGQGGFWHFESIDPSTNHVAKGDLYEAEKEAER